MALIIVLLMVSVLSCGGKQEKPKVPEKKEEVPKDLTKLDESADSIIEEIEKLQEEMKKSPLPIFSITPLVFL